MSKVLAQHCPALVACHFDIGPALWPSTVIPRTAPNAAGEESDCPPVGPGNSEKTK